MKALSALVLLALAGSVLLSSAREEPPQAAVEASSSQAAAAAAAAHEPAAPFLALLMQMLGGGGGADTRSSTNDEAKTVADLAASAPGNMSLLIDGVGRAGLSTAIADPNFEATVFAPTNWAFEVALVKLKITPAQLWTDKTALTNLLSFHTVLGKALAAKDLHDGQELTTASQHKLRVKVDKVAGTIIQGGQESAKVLAADIRGGKSIIHVIDTVLVPPKPST